VSKIDIVGCNCSFRNDYLAVVLIYVCR